MEAFVSLGRRFGRATVIGNLVYGQDPEGNERDGEVRAAAQVGMGRWTLGAEARARFALGAQHGAQAKAEPTFDLLAGPVAAATLVRSRSSPGRGRPCCGPGEQHPGRHRPGRARRRL